ncbi:MAG: amidohydrolase family protein, partial [Bacteroidia bacterium]|nr:amidohydrolase family protein [Bacteroidia bacterium]
MKRRILLLFPALLVLLRLSAQTTFPSNGAPFNPHSVYAFMNAVICIDYETQIKNGIMLIQDGKVIAAGEKIEIPKNAVVYDLKGKYIYPSFIDLYSDYGLPSNRYPKKGPGPQMESTQKGAFGWNMSIRSNQEAYKSFEHQNDKSEEYRKNGFGVVLSSFKDGIVRGSGVLLNLNSSSRENESVITDRAAGFYSFQKGSSPQDYPSSLAGSIALLRQTYYDAQWYGSAKQTEYNITLDEFNRLKLLPSVFETNDKFSVLRAASIAKEFNVSYIIKGSGNEYQRISDMQSSGQKFIIPLNFPEAYDVEDPYDAEGISLTDLKHWELAPANPAFLEKYFINFCLTTADLKDKNSFLKNLRKAIQYGLTEKMALKALTFNPASYVNAQDRIGALKKGYYANFFISSAPVFDEESSILQHWVNGEPYVYTDIDAPDLRGNYI